MCSAVASGGWGVGQAACCRPDAQTPLSAIRASQFGPTGGYRTYYDCSACPLRPSPPPSPPPPPPPSPLGCATDATSTMGTKASLGACSGFSGLDAGCNHRNGNNYQPHEWA